MTKVLDAYPACRTRTEKVACVGAAMLRLQPDATRQNIKAYLGINDRELDAVADDAIAYAGAHSERQKHDWPRVRVPARRVA